MTSAAWYFAEATFELVAVEGLRGLAHGVPEARICQPVFDGLGLVAVLFGLGQIADGAAEVLLLHAQEAHARSQRPFFGILIEKGCEEALGLIGRCAFRAAKAARSAGVRAMPEFICASFRSLLLQMAGDLGVLRMLLEILAQFGRGKAGLAESHTKAWRRAACASESLGCFEDANALGAGLGDRR
jgi:hypothetical protein